jgi:hypothetical protein
MKNPLLEIRIKKDIPFNHIRAIVEETISQHFGKSITWLEFKPECCNIIERWDIADIPLEDFGCYCGKTTLIRYIRTD